VEQNKETIMENIKKGDVIRKGFKCTISKKFPDDTIVVQSFGTEIERVCDTDAEEAELTAYVYQSTRDDIVSKSKTDPVTRVIIKTVNSKIKKEHRRDKALQESDA